MCVYPSLPNLGCFCNIRNNSQNRSYSQPLKYQLFPTSYAAGKYPLYQPIAKTIGLR
jgi:hypothetical protein